MGARVLVTGGLGFIGSHLTDALLAEGREVVVLDSLEARVHGDNPQPRLPSGVRWVRGDVRDPAAWRLALEGVGLVFHQAAYQDYMPDYSRFFEVNVAGTARLYELLAAGAGAVERVVVASSQSVYGEGQYNCDRHGRQLPLARSATQLQRGEWEVHCPICGAVMRPRPLEEDFPNPCNAYALSKLGQEMAALRLGRQIGVPTVALRYSITQGSRQSPHNAYSGVCRIFTQRLLAGLAPVVYEDGLQRRDYVDVGDVVEANLQAARDERMNWGAYNVGSGRATTVLDYAHALGRTLGIERTPVLAGQYRVGDNRHSVSSIERLTALGWSPRRSLDSTMAAYVAWYRAGGFQENSNAALSAMQAAGVVRQAAPAPPPVARP
ncbi:MAG: NAD-dependent epimerase/dehydratase family protein [Terriglobales bacterium]